MEKELEASFEESSPSKRMLNSPDRIASISDWDMSAPLIMTSSDVVASSPGSSVVNVVSLVATCSSKMNASASSAGLGTGSCAELYQ